MIIRNFEQSDYETVAGWWVSAGETPPPKEVLLDTKTYVVANAGRPVAAMSLYLGDSKWFAMVEDLAADPHTDSETRCKAIVLVWEFCQSLLRALKYKRVFCFTKHERLAQRYVEAYGLSEVGTGFVSLVKHL